MLQRTIVAGLAGTRLVRAWRYEEIGEKPREKVMAWLATPVMHRDALIKQRSTSVNMRATMVKEWLADLLDCPHCFGFWLTLGSSVALGNRRLRPLVEALAGSMILSTIVQWFPGFDFDEPDPADPVEVNLHQDDKPAT